MGTEGIDAAVWTGAALLLAVIVMVSRRARRHGGSWRAGVVGATYELLNRDKQEAVDVIVAGRAAERRGSSADDTPPDDDAMRPNDRSQDD